MISLVHRDRGRMWACYVLLALLNPSLATADEQRAKLDQFEREVRPILADHCFKCHGADKQESDLRLDSRWRCSKVACRAQRLLLANRKRVC